jgi:hypothetical protein
MPGIHESHAAIFKVGGITRGQAGTARTGDGGNLRIELGDGVALSASPGSDLWKCTRRFLVERKDVSGKVLHDHGFGLGE